jgi:hypothetical protein
MKHWESLRFFCKLTLLAFCLQRLPHFRPSHAETAVL